MHIGFLSGTGPAGSALATRLASVGFDVVLGSRSLEKATEARDAIMAKWPDRQLPIEPAVNAIAAECPVVIIATPWDVATATAHGVAEHLGGKVVISMANAIIKVGHEFQPLVPPRGSVAASVQAAVPESRVVGAFHHVPAVELGRIDHPLHSDVLVCSDHPDAAEIVSGIVRRIPNMRPLDSGELSNATAIEAFTAVLLQLNTRYKTRVALTIAGIDDSILG